MRDKVLGQPHVDDAFGVLRLLFAVLVIGSHVPELADGTLAREPLSMMGGAIDLGGLAVDCFFVISGFFIAGSFLQNSSPLSYVLKRIGRIYPGFLVASLICTLIVVPLGGGALTAEPGLFREVLQRMVLLLPPTDGGAFAGTHPPYVNAALWTIAYEFRCYVLVLVLGFCRVLHRPWVIGALAALALGLDALAPASLFTWVEWRLPLSQHWLGSAASASRFAGCFLVGTLFYLGRDKVRLDNRAAVLAALGLLIGIESAATADAAVAMFGGYLIFCAGRWGHGSAAARFTAETDLSYGVYLYAWPIEKLLLWWRPDTSLFILGVLTATLALGFGWLSWIAVESPAQDWAHRKAKSLPRRTYGVNSVRRVTV